MSDGVTKLGQIPAGQTPRAAGETQFEMQQRRRAKQIADLKRAMENAPEDAAGSALELLSRPDIVNAALILGAAKSMGRDGEALASIATFHLETVKPLADAINAGLELQRKAEAAVAKLEREQEAREREAAALKADIAAKKKALADAEAAAAKASGDVAALRGDAAAPAAPVAEGGKKK